MTTQPAVQSAWVMSRRGTPTAALQLVSNHPVPTPSGSQLLVKLHAAALNPVGWKLMGMPFVHKVPAVPESDFSGVVVAGGEGTDWKVGDEVFGITPAGVVAKTGNGTLAQYTIAEPHLVARKPKNVSHAQAATFPLAGLTAVHALKHVGGLKEGMRVFINGGSGGTGAWAVQVVKSYPGAKVVTTHSPSSASFVSSLAPTTSINYHETPLIPHLISNYSSPETQFDIIFDTVGQDPALYSSCEKYLKPEGIFVDIAGLAHLGSVSALRGVVEKLFRPRWLGGVRRRYKFFMLPADQMTEELKQAAKFLEDGSYKPIIDKEYAFSEVLQAYERQMSGRTQGKVVVQIPQ